MKWRNGAAPARQLLPTLQETLAADTVSLIACPVDYSENAKLTHRLADLMQQA